MPELHRRVWKAGACTGGQQSAHHLGKIREKQGRVIMPVTLLANHALADGVHIGAFYDMLRETVNVFSGNGA